MIRVRSVSTGVAGSPCYTNMYFQADTSVEAQAAVNAVRAFWDGIDSYVANAVTTTVEGFTPSIDEATGEVVGGFTVTQPVAVGGLAAPPLLPTMTQGLVRLRTGVYIGGREVQGRFFLPGMVEANSTSAARVEGSLIADVNSSLNTLLGTAQDLLVWSRTKGVAPAVASAAVSPTWSVLRSRRS